MAEENRLPTEEELRARVEKRIKARSEFYEHVAWYLGVNGFLWLVWLFTGAGYPWPIWPTLGWGILGVGGHFLSYYFEFGPGAARRAEMIEREVERERARIYGGSYPRKLKNDEVADDSPVRLTEDGEFTESYIDEINRNEKPKNG